MLSGMDLPLSRAEVPELIVRESSPSTNAELVELARTQQLAPYTTLVTTDQTAGRGRLDRRWIAPAGTALAISVLLAPRTGSGALAVDRYGWLTIAAGVAMTETVAALVPLSTGFKWPNDVLIGDRKVCGILAELVLERSALVMGAGINLTMSAEQLPVPTATSLALAGAADAALAADSVLAGYLGRLRVHVDAYAAADGDADASGLRQRARELCTTLGREVRIELPDGSSLSGLATDVDAAGRLEVRGPTGAAVSVAAGDVTHLRHSTS
jgi:BirA family biotin operon repressor/biotin-[acetyl-CoA-carboxylase] ligase